MTQKIAHVSKAPDRAGHNLLFRESLARSYTLIGSRVRNPAIIYREIDFTADAQFHAAES